MVQCHAKSRPGSQQVECLKANHLGPGWPGQFQLFGAHAECGVRLHSETILSWLTYAGIWVWREAQAGLPLK